MRKRGAQVERRGGREAFIELCWPNQCDHHRQEEEIMKTNQKLRTKGLCFFKKKHEDEGELWEYHGFELWS